MAFTYNPATDTGKVRLLIADTDADNPVFEDAEITAALELESSAFLFVAAQGVQPGATGPTLTTVTSIFRAAALLLDALAANRSRLGAVTQLLDVKLDPGKAAEALAERAQNYRDVDDNRGHFAIAEMGSRSVFSQRELVWNASLRSAA